MYELVRTMLKDLPEDERLRMLEWLSTAHQRSPHPDKHEGRQSMELDRRR